MMDIVALLFGAAIVVFFSYERFNRSTDEAGQQLLRLVNLLSPDKLRSRRVVANAYIFYAATFLVIYLFLCAYAQLIPALGGPKIPIGASELPAPQSTAAESNASGVGSHSGEKDAADITSIQPLSASDGSAAKGSALAIGISASTSLAVALMIVGLAPAFPILQSFEAWMRGAAHRLAGIPTRVLGIRDELRNETLDIRLGSGNSVPADTLLIPRGDWQRMSHYRAQTADKLDSPEEFHNDIALIFAVSAWIIARKLNLANLQERERFSQLEEELRRRREALFETLDEKTGYQPDKKSVEEEQEQSAVPDKDATHVKEKGSNWDKLSKQVDELADDMCILLALYIEHEVIGPASFERVLESDQSADEGKVREASGSQGAATIQRTRAMQKLKEFLKEYVSEQAGPVRARSHAMIVGLWTFFLILGITVVWSQFPGKFETSLKNGEDSGPYWRIGTYTLTAFLAYIVPMTVALAIRDGSKHLGRWRNMWYAAWTDFLPQAALILLVASGLATIIILASALWDTGIDLGQAANAELFLDSLRFSFAYNAPTAFRGAVLALIVIVLIDAWEISSRLTDSRPTGLPSFVWGGLAAIVMAIAGGITRYMTSWAGSLQALIPRESLDSIDRGLIAYAMIYSALLGFCVVFSVSEVLINLKASRRRPLIFVRRR